MADNELMTLDEEKRKDAARALYDAASDIINEIELDNEDPYSDTAYTMGIHKPRETYNPLYDLISDKKYSLPALRLLARQLAADCEEQFIINDTENINKATAFDRIDIDAFTAEYPSMRTEIKRRKKEIKEGIREKVFDDPIDKCEFVFYHIGLKCFQSGNNTLGNIYACLGSNYPELLPAIDGYIDWYNPRVKRTYKAKPVDWEKTLKMERDLQSYEASIRFHASEINSLESDKEFMRKYEAYIYHKRILQEKQPIARRLRAAIKRINDRVTKGKNVN